MRCRVKLWVRGNLLLSLICKDQVVIDNLVNTSASVRFDGEKMYLITTDSRLALTDANSSRHLNYIKGHLIQTRCFNVAIRAQVLLN